jgi:hypothetical protein
MNAKIRKINKGGKGKLTPGGIKRTTHRSSKGTKLYAVRDSKGRFRDIQTYKRAHAMDIKRMSKAETAIKRTGTTDNTGPRVKR